MSVYESTVPQFRKMLQNLDAWLGKAIEHAQKKSFDPNVFLTARLAPDQFAFARQVQATCDHAKLGSARLSGKQAPAHPDTETTIEALRARIASVDEWLATLTPADFEGAESRQVVLPFAPGKYIGGADYLTQMVLPNFYFHATTAYAILRHNGVDLGKRDFLGNMPFQDQAQQS
jgi:hypothetical protein